MRTSTSFVRTSLTVLLVHTQLLSAAFAFSPHLQAIQANVGYRQTPVNPRYALALSIGRLFDFSTRAASDPGEEKISSERVQEIKSIIKDLASGTSNGITASESTQMKISTLVTELEAANSNPDLTTSELLNGSWNLVYSTNGGSSAGKLGPFVGNVEQLIRMEGSPDYINYVRLGNGLVEGALTATWDVLPEDRWKVKFERIVFRAFGVQLFEKDLNAKGIWRMTFLDEDFRILYAAGGTSAPKENIYILAK